MPPKKDRGTKTQTLSLRLDPKTKFSLEFVARANGQTLTTVVERAIRSSCDEVKIIGDFDSKGFNWQHFWDPDEGVRTLKLLACDAYQSTYGEDELRQFTVEHWEFFYTGQTADEPRRVYVQILWPKIEEYQRVWREQRESNYWAAGEAMAADLSAARVAGPTWPRRSKSLAASGRKADMDDEIPF
jgi:hypothetical protein